MRPPRLALLACAALLAGCFSLSQPAPTIRSYRLDYPPPEMGSKPLPVVLRVTPLGAAAIYDRQAIVYRDGSYSTGTYFHDRWSTTPGSMLADLLARDLASSGLYQAVQQGPSVLPSDHQLGGQIEEIEEHKTASGCVAKLRLRLLLLRTRASKKDPIVLRRTYTEEEPSTCGDARSLAAAMSHAMARISAQIQHETYDAIASDLP